MGVGARRWGGAVAHLAVLGLWAAPFLVGCGSRGKAPAKAEEPAKPPPAAKEQPAPVDPRLQQPFAEATLAEPPDGQFRPPDKTFAGKPVGKLYNEVLRLWDTIPLAKDGKRLRYTATLKTDLGPITIELWPDVAPNHVRNFIALARAGYYDGLRFDRTIREFDEQKNPILESVEAGCPAGTGDDGYGSIGYWLNPEISDKVHHEEGTVGAVHAEAVNTAACKFYIITSGQATAMDGNWTIFGKVTSGLDVARAINRRPVRDEDEADRPRDPVVIRAVTVHCTEEGGGPAGRKN